MAWKVNTGVDLESVSDWDYPLESVEIMEEELREDD